MFLTTAPGVQPPPPRQRGPLVVPAAGTSARSAPAAPGPVPALPAHVRAQPLPADVPLPAAEPHRPPPNHLPIGRGGAAAVPGPLHLAASGPGATDGAEP